MNLNLKPGRARRIVGFLLCGLFAGLITIGYQQSVTVRAREKDKVSRKPAGTELLRTTVSQEIEKKNGVYVEKFPLLAEKADTSAGADTAAPSKKDKTPRTPSNKKDLDCPT